MSEFYTNVATYGNKVLYRGRNDDGAVTKRFDYQPSLFVPSNKESKYKTLDGRSVERINPGTIKECRQFIERYDGVSGFEIFGNTNYVYQFINDAFPKEVEYDFSKVVIANIDIETECENGFPDIENANERIIAITMIVGDDYHVFGLGEFNVEREGKNVQQYKFDNEEDLLTSFVDLWSQIEPEIVTGWNIDFFDIPYMVHRMQRLFGEDFPKKLSPWKVIRSRKVFMRDKKHTIYKILGVSVLDYLETYRNYTFVNQESYSLNHIAWVELGAEKLSYAEYDSMAEFYKRDFPKFMEYNVKDVELVQQLDDKLRLLELNASIAYLAKCNYEDVFGQVRTWDCIIYQHLRDQNIVIPQMKNQSKSEQYAGAYVKDPIVGKHDWVVSFDLNSLYPHLIMQYNISPETKVPNNKDHSITPDSILNGKDVPHDAYSVAANGTCYTKDKQGFLPALMEQMYADRKQAKKKMIACQKERQSILKSGALGADVSKLLTEKDMEIAKWGTRQMALKIALNSAYGALGNQWFRFFDVDMAEAITLSGQLSIRWIADKLNEFLNTTVGTEGYDYVVASDTDSVYLRLGNLVEKVCGGRSKSEVVKFLDKASEEIIIPFIEEKYGELACKMNAYQNKMVMEREVIADTGVWTAKKRYVLNVHNSEGVQYDEPKLKIMGIETTRSSTPNVVRQELKEAIRIIMQEDEVTLHKFVADFEKRFKTLDPEEVAFPRSVRAMEKYANTSTVYSKGTPIAVKGALIHNNLLKVHKLTTKYQTIKNGEKIKFLYLKSPNPSGEKVISFLNSLPKEFDLTPFVDYNLQFEKAFLDPLKTILDSVGWNHEEVATLEGLFV